MRKEVTLIRMDRDTRETLQGEVAREFPLTVMLNDEQLATLLCSPDDMENLAVGFLYSEGFIRTKEDIRGISLDEHTGDCPGEYRHGRRRRPGTFHEAGHHDGVRTWDLLLQFCRPGPEAAEGRVDPEGNACADPGPDEVLPDATRRSTRRPTASTGPPCATARASFFSRRISAGTMPSTRSSATA